MLKEQGWILNRATLTPEKIALIDIHKKRQWSYEKVAFETKIWFHFLYEKGVKKGDRVAILAENCIDVFPILFACGLGGFIYVPLNWRLSERELAMILDDCTPSLLITDQKFEDMGKKLLPNKSLILYAIETEVIENERLHIENWDRTDPWLLIYTGGTTGKPKGVILSFDAVNWNAINTILSWNLNADDCTLNYMPLFHTGGINALALPILMIGGTVVIGNKFIPEEAIRAIDDYKTTISLFVPTMYQAMIETEYFSQSIFPTVKVFLSGGAPCPKTIYHHFQGRGLKFKEGYGLTEAGPNNFFITPERAERKLGSVGKSMLFNSIKIMNADGKLCMANEVGELYVQGKHVFTKYWNNQEETNKTIKDGWLRTGDLAKMDQDGDIFIVGRLKDMIISGGENVYPQEVEQCIITHPKIREVAVVGLQDQLWGEVVTAFIVSVEETNELIEEVISLCRDQLSSFKVPKKVYFIDELPKTPVGKIDKKQLMERFVV